MTDKWRDLGPRLISAVVLLAVAIGAAWAGPFYFAILVCIATGLMVWELARMHEPRFQMLPEIMAAATTAVVFTTYPLFLGILVQFAFLATLVFVALLTIAVKRDMRLFAPYVFAILITGNLLAGLFMASPRHVFFLLIIVIVTDVAGYFAGKSIGGRKFWPRVSPKKTWSGVIAGWIASGCVGIIAVAMGHYGILLIGVAMLMSFASQLGDIAESALKRRAGVKDGSNLIRGHGGVLDRVDGVVGASMVLFLYMVL